MQRQPAPRDGDEIEVGEYDDDGTRHTRRLPVRRVDGRLVVVDGEEEVPIPRFIGRHSGEWETKRAGLLGRLGR